MKKYAVFTIIYALILALSPLAIYLPIKYSSSPPPSTSSASGDTALTSAAAVSAAPLKTIGDASVGTDFLILNSTSGEVLTVSEHEYLFGMLAGELDPDAHPEAIKAQAVAGYSNACLWRNQQIAKPSSQLKGAHFTDDPSVTQAYLTDDEIKAKWGDKYDVYAKKFNDCINSVTGEVVSYKGKIVYSPFFAISSGQTEYAKNVWGNDVAYLQPVQCPGDILSPDYRSTVTYTKAEFIEKSSSLNTYVETDTKFALSDSAETFVAEPSVTTSGTVIGYPLGGATFTGQEMRTAFGLRSANFSVTSDDKENITFTVNGYGHNVGMSQYGANQMAEQGSNYIQILKYFYTGVDIVQLVNTK